MDAPNILILEPDAKIAKLIRVTLEETLPVVTTLVEQADQVEQATREAPPDMILLNVATRKFNAFQLVGRLKANPATQKIPVLAVGAWGDQIALARAMGCDDSLPFPFRIYDVVAKVLKYLDVQPKILAPDAEGAASRVSHTG